MHFGSKLFQKSRVMASNLRLEFYILKLEVMRRYSRMIFGQKCLVLPAGFHAKFHPMKVP